MSKQEYKFKKKNGKFIWKNKSAKIVFKKLSFQASDDYAYVENTNQIMYMYYTVDIYQKKVKYYQKKGIECKFWDKISSAHAYDFPCLEQLRLYLEKVLGDIPLEECRKIQYYHNGELLDDIIGYEWKGTSEGFACDDYYEVEKTIVLEEGENKKEDFSLYFGSPTQLCGEGSSFTYSGIKLDYVTREGIELLLRCINEFFEHGIKKHNKKIKERNLQSMNSFYVMWNKLYQNEDGHLDSIYVENEKVDEIISLVGNIEGTDYHSIEYKDTIIAKITPEYLLLKGGYTIDDNHNTEQIEEMCILTNTILFIMDKDNGRIKFNEDEIANDFIKYLSETEINEMKAVTWNGIYNKWKEVLIQRYWMCCDVKERFKTKVEDKGHNENAYDAAKEVSRVLKSLVGNNHSEI